MAFQNVLSQRGRPNRPEKATSTLRPSNTSVHLCICAMHTLEFDGDFGKAEVFKSQIWNHHMLFEPRHFVCTRSQKL
jgi:hypothetical protein